MTFSFHSNDISNIVLTKTKLKKDKDVINFGINYLLSINGLRPLSLKNSILAGGAIGSILRGEPPKDYDFFFLKDIQIESVFDDLSKVDERVVIKENKYLQNSRILEVVDININDKIIELYNLNKKPEEKVYDSRFFVQIMLTDYDNFEDLINDFDFEHCKTYLNFTTDKLTVSPYTYGCIMRKVLFARDLSKVQEYRILQFTERGFEYIYDNVDNLERALGLDDKESYVQIPPAQLKQQYEDAWMRTFNPKIPEEFISKPRESKKTKFQFPFGPGFKLSDYALWNT